MEYSSNIIPVVNQNDIKSYVDTKLNDVKFTIQDILSKITSVNTQYNDLISELTSLSNSLPKSSVELVSNFGTTLDFEQGVNDILSSSTSDNTTFLYQLGKEVGSYIEKIYQLLGDITLNVSGSNNIQTLSFSSLVSALSYIQGYTKVTINITEQITDNYQYQFQYQNSKYLTITSSSNNYVLKFINLNNVKSSFLFKNVDKIIFNNITFINSDPVNTNNLSSIENASFIVDNCNIEFVNCTFIDNSKYDTYLLFSGESDVYFRNCTFNKTTSSNLYLLTSYNGYPSNTYFINMDLSKLQTNVKIVEPNSTSLVNYKSII